MAETAATTEFNYTTTSTRDAERCDSLGETLGGPVRVSSNHMLAVAMEQAGFKLTPAGAGFVTIDMRMIDDLTQTNLVFDEALDNEHIAWHVVPTRLSALFRSLEGAGVSLSGRYADIRITLTRAIGELPEDERLIKKRDTLSPGTALAGWYSSATAAACRGLGSDNARLLMLRAMIPTPYASDTTKNATVVACASMLGPLTAADPLGTFLEIITSFPAPPRPQLHRYVPAAAAPFEIKRQMASSEVERFAPLFDDVYKFAYPNISNAFPAVANAGEMRTIIATILARVGIMTGATDTSVSLIDRLAEALRHSFMGEWGASPLVSSELSAAPNDSRSTVTMIDMLVAAAAKDTHGGFPISSQERTKSPCVDFNKPNGCRRGASCTFTHVYGTPTSLLDCRGGRGASSVPHDRDQSHLATKRYREAPWTERRSWREKGGYKGKPTAAATKGRSKGNGGKGRGKGKGAPHFGGEW